MGRHLKTIGFLLTYVALGTVMYLLFEYAPVPTMWSIGILYLIGMYMLIYHSFAK